MSIRIRKCANPKCSDIISIQDRANKKFCSKDCKTQSHNEKVKKVFITWDKILDRYDELPKDKFVSLTKWLKVNYYPPRIIKQKK